MFLRIRREHCITLSERAARNTAVQLRLTEPQTHHQLGVEWGGGGGGDPPPPDLFSKPLASRVASPLWVSVLGVGH